MKLPSAIRRPLRRVRRAMFEAFGSARYSRMALNDLDRKLERHLDFNGGFFVEAGANDGVQQSNTYYFEKFRDWSGLLIEPLPELASRCRKNRRGPVVEAALVARDEPGATVEIHFAGLMSAMTGALGDEAATAAHVAGGLKIQELAGTYTVRAPARTLSGILDTMQVDREIDLLSLDVEGGEAAALRGLDLARHAPRFICVEARAGAEIEALLLARYRVAEILTDLKVYQDVLYQRR